MYEYNATITRIVDGDTLIADIDLGFYTIVRKQTFRLSGLNAPELSTIEGKDLADRLRALLENKQVIIKTTKDRKEKYGRYLATIMLGELNVNQWLIDSGLAKVMN